MRIILTILFLLNLNSLVFAQQDKIKTNTITIMDNFIPEVPDSDKMDFLNNHIDTIIIKNKFKYILFDSHLDFLGEDINISSVKIKGHPVDKLYNSYIKAGSLINSLSPNMHFYYNSLRLKNKQGLNFGLNGDYKTLKFDKMNINSNIFSLGVFAKKTDNKGVIKSNLNYLNNDYNCYANTEDQRKYNLTSLKIDYSNLLEMSNNIDFDLFVDAYSLNIENSYFEKALGLGIDIEGNFFDKEFMTSASVEFEQIGKNEFSIADNATVFDLLSTTSWDFQDINIKSGFVYTYNEGNHIYPHFEIIFNKDKNYNNLELFITGNYVQNNILERILENPYLSDSVEMREQNQKFKFILNHNTKFSKKLYNKNSIVFYNIKDRHFFELNDTTNRFNIIYDDVKNLQLKSELLYYYNKKLDIMTYLVYNKFFMTYLEHPFYNTEFDFIFQGNYNYSDKFNFNLSFNSGFNRWSNNQTSMDPILFAKLNLNYTLNSFLDIHFTIDNLHLKKYEIWENYLVFPTSILIQLSYIL